ncbi:MAG: ABC transporter ATP-binding protein [Chitinophagaceae bacterium]|nr:ABC transporter ATP-binding protein [Chitinophagaceae bacterium]
MIKVEGLGKKYLIDHEREGGYTALRDVISSRAKRIFGEKRATLSTKEEFWAIKDLDFEIKRGEAVGIIGKNGAGKSTLLKVLSRITEPTLGRIELNGRVASLLEVGTGFHPELTGRENVFLNGAILGMGRSEIRRKFDEIVDFSGVERFLDTPVKRYSSGMYVRLAFAVAAFLEPEILIVDEVLAVGDAEFQKKCLGKMQQVSRGEGRTVLFVSHNMAAVKSLCSTGIVLKNGRMDFYGSNYEAVQHYQNHNQSNTSFHHEGEVNLAPGNASIRILQMDVVPQEGEILSMNSGVEFRLKVFNSLVDRNLDVTFEVANNDDIIIFHQGVILTSGGNSKIGVYEVSCVLPKLFLNAGSYNIKLIFGENQRYLIYEVSSFLSFEIVQESAGSNSSRLPGVTFPELSFKVITP